MFESIQHIKKILSPLDPGASSKTFAKKESISGPTQDLTAHIEELKKVNRELLEARRAALNMMEDAILSKEALRSNERIMRKQKEAFQSAIDGSPLAVSLNIIASLVTEEMEARTAFYLADKDNKYLHPILGAGNMPDDYLKQIDGFTIGENSFSCGLAIPTGLPVITEDIFNDPSWKPLVFIAREFNIRACWSFPIRTGQNKAVGTFAMYLNEAKKPAAKDLALADVVLQTAGVIISSHTNTRQRDYAEQALRKSEEKLRMLNSSLEQEVHQRTIDLVKQHEILKQAEELAQVGSWEYTIKTKEFTWSDGMYALFRIGKGSKLMPSVYIDHAVEKDRPIAKKITDAIQKNFEPFEEVLHIKFNDEERILQIKAMPFKNESGEIEKMLGVDMDITERQKSEEKITELNRSLSAMNKDLNMLNSELRNFNSIAANNYSETLRHVYIHLETIVTTDARNLSNSSRANVRRAQSGIQKMKLLTNDINNYLELYDIGIQKELIDPGSILTDVKEKMWRKLEDANATVDMNLPPRLFADPRLFSKLMINLIDNSIKFKKPDEDPVIKISYSMVADLNSNPKAQPDTAYTIITIKDNGTGFKDADADKIFEVFTQLDTTKYKGSGIGLAICKKIMEMHGGFTTADSVPGDGAYFHCYFPSK